MIVSSRSNLISDAQSVSGSSRRRRREDLFNLEHHLRFARQTHFCEIHMFVVADLVDLSGLDPKYLSQMLCFIAVEFGTVVSNLRDKETSARHLLSLYPRSET